MRFCGIAFPSHLFYLPQLVVMITMMMAKIWMVNYEVGDDNGYDEVMKTVINNCGGAVDVVDDLDDQYD